MPAKPAIGPLAITNLPGLRQPPWQPSRQQAAV